MTGEHVLYKQRMFQRLFMSQNCLSFLKRVKYFSKVLSNTIFTETCSNVPEVRAEKLVVFAD